MEPEQLRRGKSFHSTVQNDFSENSKDGEVNVEASLPLDLVRKGRRGRVDILIDDLGDFVTILEIKGTDWDRIPERNVKRNLYRHQRQAFRYIDEFVVKEGTSVCHGIVYPAPPARPGLKNFIENYMMDTYSIPVYWYTDIRTDGWRDSAKELD